MVASIGTLLNDRFGQRGIEAAWLGLVVDRLRGDPLGALLNLHDQFLETALGRATDGFEREAFTEIAPYLGMPNPSEMLRTLAPWIDPGYAPGTATADLAVGDPSLGIIGKIFKGNRRAAARYERLLETDPVTREMFELLIGGRIVHFGDEDGRFAVRPFSENESSSEDSPGERVTAYIQAMQRAAYGALGQGGYRHSGAPNASGRPFESMLLAGLAASAGLVPAGPGWRWSDNTGPLGGRGLGSPNPHARPGIINATNEDYESQHLDQCSAILRDPSLSVEDKVTLFIMLIMEKADKDIKNQAEYINSLQNMQGRRAKAHGQGHGGSGQGGSSMGPWGQPYGSALHPNGADDPSERDPDTNRAGDDAPAQGAGHGSGYNDKYSSAEEQKDSTIEIETLKLKRMVDKRGQMFDMLRQIIDRYNQSAKSIIETIGR